MSVDKPLVGRTGAAWVDLGRRLGSGKFGVVTLGYAANDVTRRVALKHIALQAVQAEDRHRVEREVALMMRLGELRHAHILRLVDVCGSMEPEGGTDSDPLVDAADADADADDDNGIDTDTNSEISMTPSTSTAPVRAPKTMTLVLELCEGGDLLQLVQRKGRLGEEETRKLFRQMTSALSTAHVAGIIHRDIKVENIFLDAGGNIKIGDWGFACEWGRGRRLSEHCGSLPYAAPEMVSGKQYNGPEVDIWSLGVVLYALLTGSFPFRGANEKQVAICIADGNYHVPDYLSPAARQLLGSMLAVNPGERPSAADLLRHAWLSGASMAERRSASVPSPMGLSLPSIREDDEFDGGKEVDDGGIGVKRRLRASSDDSSSQCRSNSKREVSLISLALQPSSLPGSAVQVTQASNPSPAGAAVNAQSSTTTVDADGPVAATSRQVDSDAVREHLQHDCAPPASRTPKTLLRSIGKFLMRRR